MSNLSGVFGSLSNNSMQIQAETEGFRAEKKTRYTDNNVIFVKGICHVFEPFYVSELWKEWGKTDDVLTGRNLLMKRMVMFDMGTGIGIYPSIYIENRVMEELMKE